MMRISTSSPYPMKFPAQKQVRFGTQTPQQQQNSQPSEQGGYPICGIIIPLTFLAGSITTTVLAATHDEPTSAPIRGVAATLSGMFGLMSIGLLARGCADYRRSNRQEASPTVPVEEGLEIQQQNQELNTQASRVSRELAIV